MNRLTGFSLVVRRIIRDRATIEVDGFEVVMCEVWQECEGALAEQLHHRRARQRGGSRRPDTNMPANSLAACGPCHSWIESQRKQAHTNGWLVYQSGQPATVPVLRRGEWVLLGDDGSVVPHDIPSIESAAQGIELDEAARCVNTIRPLTHPADITRQEG